MVNGLYSYRAFEGFMTISKHHSPIHTQNHTVHLFYEGQFRVKYLVKDTSGCRWGRLGSNRQPSATAHESPVHILLEIKRRRLQ